MEDQPNTNSFEEVHRKIKAFKDRMSTANKNDLALRASRADQEKKEILDHERTQPKPQRRLPGKLLRGYFLPALLDARDRV